MKNSLFKRAIATAAAVPLALTQCLTYSNAAVSTVAPAPGNAVQADSANALTLEELLYIAPETPVNADGYQVSSWNQTLSAALTQAGAKTGTISEDALKDLASSIAGNLGQYGEVVEGALTKCVIPNGVTYEIKGNHDIIIKGKVSQPTFHTAFGFSVGEALEKLAEKYGAPAMTEIDFSSVKVAGDFTLTIGASMLEAGTEVPVSFEYKTVEGDSISAGEMPQFLIDKLAEIEEIGFAAIEENIPEEYQADAKDDFSEQIDKLIKMFERADNYVELALGKEVSAGYENMAGVIQAANNWIARQNINRQLPATATDIANNSVVASVYDIILDVVAPNGGIDIEAAEIGAWADSITNITVNASNGKGTLSGKFDDAEQEEVKAWVEAQGNEFVDSYKLVSATVDFSGINTVDAGSVDVEIKRVLVTQTTTTTTTETTTTETTTTETTTSATETTTSETTTSETTTSATETTTSETTTSETTTSATETTTSETTTTASETTTTSSETTSAEITTSIITSYVSADTTYGFYLNTDEEFDTAQIENVTLHVRYVEGYTTEDGRTIITNEDEITSDITADVKFATTPDQAYDKENSTFKYEITLVSADNESLTDYNGRLVTATAYIGVKGDVNLDNMADAVDASQVLAYYAALSTEGRTPYDVTLSGSSLVTGPDSVYDEFAAFLGDVHHINNAYVPRTTLKGARLIDAVDASNILAFYARRSSSDYDDMTNKEIWDALLSE